ncbi:serine protease Do [Devosia enhydra]|uniref:Probable periplasmic serine endoprotease DegP-like n=1 Tax=Devosia enhydra TaxID=665118 RepID=A0A1K2HW51_9HYPH|nr:Do family serine endopeptidase [Devosia enhydra]SFZ82801.1 serine protease Do [Devosia enhydra]
MMTLRTTGKALAMAGLLLGMAAVALPATAQAQTMAGPASVSGLASTLSPAVVNIGTARRMPSGRGMPFPDVPDGSPLEELFDELNPNSGMGQDLMEEARSLGSGFIIAPDGLIVTNNHVIDGASEILVFLNDGTRHVATVVGKDDKTDLAVLRISANRSLPYVEFGDSDAALVGDWVMAIGNPFGLGGSVTLGIVSARNRDIQSGPYDNFIQTDASINQGNSGGPLFDMQGKVVGINTAIIARGGSSLGIGFAVPVNLARPVIDQLAEFGETRRGWLGVGIQDVTDDIAASLGRPDTAGALVVDVTDSGPSDGVVLEGDIILEFDGKPIRRMRDLPRIVAETAVGRSVPVTLLRRGEQMVLTIELGRLEVGEQMMAEAAAPEPVLPPPTTNDEEAEEPAGPPGLSDLVGFDVAPLDDAARADLALAPEIQGVVVTRVVQGSDASRKGFLEGVLVEEVNQVRIETVDQIMAMVGEAKEAGRPAVLFKISDPAGGSRFVAVRLG